MSNLDNIKDKIQKLLNKAESAKDLNNIEEAAAFSAKVNELLTKYNLEKSDIELKSEDDISEDFPDLVVTTRHGTWTGKLLTVLGNFNYCKVILHGQKNMIVSIIGEPNNIEIVTFLYSILQRQFETNAKEKFREYLKSVRESIKEQYSDSDIPNYNKILAKPWRFIKSVSSRSQYLKSYYLGAIHGVNQKLQQELEKNNTKYGNKLNTLIKVNDDKIDRFIEEKYSDLKNRGQRKLKVNSDAYNSGYDNGINSKFSKGVASGHSVATKSLQ